MASENRFMPISLTQSLIIANRNRVQRESNLSMESLLVPQVKTQYSSELFSVIMRDGTTDLLHEFLAHKSKKDKGWEVGQYL